MLAANLIVCKVVTLLFAGNAVISSGSPRGTCWACCALNERNDIQFLLYTSSNPTQGYRLFLDDDIGLSNSSIQFDKPLVVFVHGFSESATLRNRSSQEVKNAFLSAGDYNVLLIDWSPLVTFPWYPQAVANVPVASRYIAQFLHYLIKRGYSAERIHLIGFSLGGQAAGYVGRELQKSGIRVPRITALDPAGPLFTDGLNSPLRPDDADFVDVIHTDGGVEGHMGPLGHADFFPNDGRPLQPGCLQESINKPINNVGSPLPWWLSIIADSAARLQNVALTATCSHQRAWKYFAESVRFPQAFPATRCEPSEKFSVCEDLNGHAYMGMGANDRLRGKFYLKTNGSPFYGQNTTVLFNYFTTLVK